MMSKIFIVFEWLISLITETKYFDETKGQQNFKNKWLIINVGGNKKSMLLFLE